MTEPPEQQENPAQLATVLRENAREIGFELFGIAPAVAPGGFGPLQDWLKKGFAGEMSYMPRREEAYSHPQFVLEGVRSVVLVGLNYFDRQSETTLLCHSTRASVPSRSVGEGARRAGEGGRLDTSSSPSSGLRPPSPPQGGEGTEAVLPGGRVAKYATGTRDYHDVLKKKLKSLAGVLHEARPGCRTRGIVDTAPLLERDFARLAGLGWFGKNTMLISKREGSFFFLGALLTDVELPADEPHHTDHCGTCTACLEACPTDAFPEPYVLDSNRCISYLTIELRDQPVPAELRSGMGEWLFGCDICQNVCPWNRKAPQTTVEEFRTDASLSPASLVELLSLDEAQFRERFRKTPLFRPGRAGLLRNAAIVAGNSGDARLLPALRKALADDEELVRSAAAWALGQLGGSEVAAVLRRRFEEEASPVVRSEIEAALENATSSQASP